MGRTGGSKAAHMCHYCTQYQYHTEAASSHLVCYCMCAPFLCASLRADVLFLLDRDNCTKGTQQRAFGPENCTITTQQLTCVQSVVMIQNLPYDAYKLLAVPSPIGGVLVLCANTIHYYSQVLPLQPGIWPFHLLQRFPLLLFVRCTTSKCQSFFPAMFTSISSWKSFSWMFSEKHMHLQLTFVMWIPMFTGCSQLRVHWLWMNLQLHQKAEVGSDFAFGVAQSRLSKIQNNSRAWHRSCRMGVTWCCSPINKDWQLTSSFSCIWWKVWWQPFVSCLVCDLCALLLWPETGLKWDIGVTQPCSAILSCHGTVCWGSWLW
jgi:hypothetical protein